MKDPFEILLYLQSALPSCFDKLKSKEIQMDTKGKAAVCLLFRLCFGRVSQGGQGKQWMW